MANRTLEEKRHAYRRDTPEQAERLRGGFSFLIQSRFNFHF
jgi:hypothetical protein